MSTAVSPVPQPGLKYARLVVIGSLCTIPVSRSTVAVKPPRLVSVALLVKVRGAYTTTAWRPEPVTHALPIHRSVSNPGSDSVAAVHHV